MIDWLLSFITAAGAIIIVVVVIAFFVASAFTLLAAKIVKVENATYGRALAATFLGGLAGGAAAFLLGLIPIAGTVLGIIGGWLIDSLVVMAIFRTSYGKGLLVTLLARVLAAAVTVGIVLLLVLVGLLSCV